MSLYINWIYYRIRIVTLYLLKWTLYRIEICLLMYKKNCVPLIQTFCQNSINSTHTQTLIRTTTHANCLQLILPVFFRSKVANIRTATASAKPPVIDPRQVPPLSQFQSATIEEITRLINTMPAKSCSLNPIPTWLLKRLTPHIAPVICKLCNLSLHNGVFPTPLKQALVLPILKKIIWTLMLPVRIAAPKGR